MKKILLLFAAFFALAVTFASSNLPVKPVLMAKEVFIPIGVTGQKISLWDLSRISIREAETISGRKMNFWDRMGFKAAQSKLRKQINPDGTINGKRLTKQLKKIGDGEGFHLGGFALGFLLGLIGVLIAYLINDDKKRNRVKWAWIGWVAWLVILLLILLA